MPAPGPAIPGSRVADLFGCAISVIRRNATFGNAQTTLKKYASKEVGYRYLVGVAALSNTSGRSFYELTIAAYIAQVPGGTVLGEALQVQTTPESRHYVFPYLALPETRRSAIDARSLTLQADDDVVIMSDDQGELDRGSQTWASGPWFVQFQVGSVDASHFRDCCHVLLPSIVRLGCYIHPKNASGSLQHLSDDSLAAREGMARQKSVHSKWGRVNKHRKTA